MPLTWHTAGAVSYTALFASLLAYVAWNHGVKVLGPSTASLFSYLVPVFTALLGVLLLQEQLRWFHLAGGALTFMGLLVADRKSTRLNSSHVKSSYAVFCLKKKKDRRLPCARHAGM